MSASEHPPPPLQSTLRPPPRRPVRIAIVALAVSLAYAIVRYHIFKGVPWSQFPLFTINKAVAVVSLVAAWFMPPTPVAEAAPTAAVD